MGIAKALFVGTTANIAGTTTLAGVTATSITDSGLTSGRVTYAGTAGLLQDSANLTFNGTTLTANTIGAFTLSGTVAGGGNQLNNVIIGTSTPLAGAFTTLSATGDISLATTKQLGWGASPFTCAIEGASGASGYIRFATNNAFQMLLDASGNLGIGTSSPSALLDLQSSGTTQLEITSTGASGNMYVLSSRADGTFRIADDSAGQTRLTIDENGNLGIGTTSPSAKLTIVSAATPVLSTFTSTLGGYDSYSTDDASGARFFTCFNSGGSAIGSISRVTTTNAVTFNTTSDYRLKTIVGAVTGQGERIDALKPIDYQWTESGQQARGFLAHEFQEVYASSVTGTKDAVDEDGNPIYQGMQAGTAEVIADLVAELQSLRKRITALEAK